MIRFLAQGAKEAGREIARIDAKIRRAEVRALNRVAVTARKRSVKEITGQVRLTAGYVRERIRIRRAAPARPEVRLRANRRPVLLTRYGARIRKAKVKHPERSVGDLSRGIAPGRKAAGVSVAVKRGGRRKRLNRAFFIWLNSGGWGVAERTGAGRGDFKVLHGPSVDQLFRRVKDEEAPRAIADLRRVLDREIAFELSR